MELALSILANLAFRSEANRNQLGLLGVVPPLAALLCREGAGLRQQAARLLASVVCQHPDNHAQAVSCGAIQPLVEMLAGNDADKVLSWLASCNWLCSWQWQPSTFENWRLEDFSPCCTS